MSVKRLEGKVAIVTGGGSGIGKAIALAFAKEGADVIIPDINFDAAKKTAKEVEDLGCKALPLKTDVSQRVEVEFMVDETLKRFGRIDILVNNAGITIVKPFEEFSEEEWDRVLSVNLKGVFLCSQLVGKQMIKQGRGKIINLSSIVGEIALPRRSAYCVSKAAIIMFTKVLAVEWAKYNINVNAIGPGYVETEMVASLVREGVVDRERLKKRIPKGRLASPEEIAKLAVFLASEESDYITGETVFMDGGFLAYCYY